MTSDAWLDDLDGLSADARRLVSTMASRVDGRERTLQVIGLAALLYGRGMKADAARLALWAIDEAGGDEELALRARSVFTLGLPHWHVPMLNDHDRTSAYAGATRRAVRPGMLVLDIGTGSGLLALMAARAGAEMVIACEHEPALALIAQRNVRRAGYDDRVRVIAKHSRSLTVGIDLPRRADLLISELVTNTLLGDGVLDSLEGARRDLLTAEAPAIPSRGIIHAALAEGDVQKYRPITEVAGLDVSSINLAAPTQYRMNRASPVTLLTESVDLLTFDFSGHSPDRPEAAGVVTAVRDGVANGVLLWMTLQLDDRHALTTMVEAGRSHWEHVFVPLAAPRSVQVGDRTEIRGSHGRDSVTVWAPAP